MEVVEWRRAGFRPFPFCLISIQFDGQFPAHVVEWRGAGIWASECWCDSTEWCVNVAPATADGVRTLSFRFFFLFLMGRICWCRTHRGGCRGFVSYSSFDHQLLPTLRHGKYEIRNTTTRFNQKNRSEAIRRWIGEIVQVHHPTGTFNFFPRHPPLRLLASNSLTDTPFLLFLLLLLPFLLRDLRIHHINPHSQYPTHPTLDGTGNA